MRTIFECGATQGWARLTQHVEDSEKARLPGFIPGPRGGSEGTRPEIAGPDPERPRAIAAIG